MDYFEKWKGKTWDFQNFFFHLNIEVIFPLEE